MTPRERLLAAHTHQPTDQVPFFEQALSSRVASRIFGRPMHTGGTGLHYEQALAAQFGPEEAAALDRKILEDTVAATREFEFCLAGLPWRWGAAPTAQLGEYTFRFGPEDGWWSIYRYDPVADLFGQIDSWLRHEGPVGVEAIVAAEEASAAQVTRPGRGIGADLQYMMDELGDDYAYPGPGGFGIPMEVVWLETLALRPDLIERHLDAQLEHNLAGIEAHVAAGCLVIYGGGDLATGKGPIYSPGTFRRLMLPRLKAMTDLCHELGVPYVWRSDGDLWPLADALFVEAGADAYGEIDSGHGMDVAEIRAAYPELVLWGAIDCGELLVRGTRDQVVAETRRQIEAVGHGHILCSSNAILAHTPPENFLAMWEVSKQYGDPSLR